MDPDIYCRLCRVISDNLIDIFSDNDHRIIILLKIKSTLGIAITKNDVLSHRICPSCLNRIEEYYIFSKKCHQVQFELSNDNTSNAVSSVVKMVIDELDTLPNPTEYIKTVPTESYLDDNNSVIETTVICVATDDDDASSISLNNSPDRKNCSSPTAKEVTETTNVQKISYSKLSEFLRSKVKFDRETEESTCSTYETRLNALNEKIEVSLKEIDSITVEDVSEAASSLDTLVAAAEIRSADAKLIEDVVRPDRKSDPKNSKNGKNSSVSKHILNSNRSKSGYAPEHSILMKQIMHLTSEELMSKIQTRKKAYAKNKDQNFVKCPYCGEIFTRQEFSAEHMLLHTDDEELHKIILEHIAPTPVLKQLQCELCNMPFNRELSYMEHMNQHIDHRPIKCHLCDRTFFGHKKTRAHIRAHLVSTFKCESCSYVAKTSQDLRKHERGVHTGERIICNVCGKLLSAFEHNMKKHLETHSETRPYNCDLCEKSFKTQAAVSRHRENRHFPVPVMCSLCGTLCGSKQKYKKHISKCRKKIKTMNIKK